MSTTTRTLWPALLLMATVGCADGSIVGTCLDDQACPLDAVCAFGLCVDPDALGAVDIEVEPVVASGLPTQSVFDLDTVAGDRIDVELERSVNVTGGVVSIEGGGVPATVTAIPERTIAGRRRQVTAAATDGPFSLPLVVGASYRLQAVPTDRSLPPMLPDDTFVAGTDTSPALVMTSLRDPEGRIVEHPVAVLGRIVAGVGVAEQGIPDLEVLILDAEGRRVSSLASSDIDGAFVVGLSSAVVDARFVVRPSEQNTRFPTLVFPIDLGSEAVVDLGVVSLGSVSVPVPVGGEVRTASGAPARGAVVSFRGLIGAGVAHAQTTTSDEGRFSVALHPGVYSVAAVGELTGTAGMTVTTATIVEAITDLVITVPERVAANLRVATADDIAVPLASIVLSRIGDGNGLFEPVLSEAQPVFLGSADDSGQVTLAVDPGRYRVSIQPPRGTGAPAFSTLMTIVEPLDRDIILPPSSVVAGALSDGSGDAVAGAFVRVFSSLTDELGRAIFLGEAVSNADGTFEVFVPTLGR